VAEGNDSEQLRLAALREYRILGTSPDPAFDRITDLASQIFRVPAATIGLVDEHRVWFKSHFGIEIEEIDRATALSNIAIGSDEVVVIPDVRADSRFQLAIPTLGGMRVAFFAGAPLITPAGHRIGVLAIRDTRPRAGLTPEEISILKDLASMALDELSLQVELRRSRESTESLQQSEARFRTLMESASQAILGVNREGVIQMVNRKSEELFGYEREELIGQKLEMLLPESLREKHVHDRTGYFGNPHPRPMGIGLELKGRRKNGKEFPVEISLNYVNAGGDPLAISFITDITERMRMEQQLRQSQKMEAIGQLAGGVAHDFNNLLTVMSGYSHMALEALPPEASLLRESIQEIANAAERAAVLTGQLLAFGRKQVVQPKRFNINERVQQVHNILRRLIGEDIQLDLALEDDLGDVLADPGQIDQVIINLVVNARDAMPQGGRILIETASIEVGQEYARGHFEVDPGPHVMLAITDTGMGMTAEVQAHIFEPFFTTKEQGKGTGLGLATVYGIVKQARGSIFVYSESGRGTTFKLIFPRLHPAFETESRVREHEAPGGAETVLLVEDEEPVRAFVGKVLRDRGYSVVEAKDGEHALSIAAESDLDIDLILTDVVMPKANGPEVVSQLRVRYPASKVLFMSGYTDRTVPLDTEYGTAFIQKPFTPNQLAQKIREVLAQRNNA
jgi:two-component system cell cycle sensor histidine kinase/response regulator CckA